MGLISYRAPKLADMVNSRVVSSRSLNVHVSGAIMIWEYTKQQTAQEMKTESSAVHNIL